MALTIAIPAATTTAALITVNTVIVPPSKLAGR
jgi:hypothetical protein